MRTLVISDLHLGQRNGVSVLERARPLELLLEAISDCQRLVLLGDVVELKESGSAHAFPVAEPVLRAIGAALGPDRQVLMVPGNHDHALIREWTHAQGAALQRESAVPPDATALLAEVVSWLAPAPVEVRYPGVWLSDGIWATHGHYLNQYLTPISSVGLLHPRHRRGDPELREPAAYERIAGSRAESHMRDGLPSQRWHDGRLPRQLAPMMVRMLATQMRRHSLPAMARAVHALDVDADWVIFGHVHRRGPLAGDHLNNWLGTNGRQRLLNTGCWRFEDVILHRARPPHPYWPGGTVVIDGGQPPRTVGLLDGLTEMDFR